MTVVFEEGYPRIEVEPDDSTQGVITFVRRLYDTVTDKCAGN